MTDWEVRGGPGAGSRGRAVGRTMRQGERTQWPAGAGAAGAPTSCATSQIAALPSRTLRTALVRAPSVNRAGIQVINSVKGGGLEQKRWRRFLAHIISKKKLVMFFLACPWPGHCIALHCTLCSLWRTVFAIQQVGIISMVLLVKIAKNN